jgi:hypothetical protein
MRAAIRDTTVGATMLVALAGCDRSVERSGDAGAAQAAAVLPASTAPSDPRTGLLYGRVTLENGEVYEGRLRWGGDEEALWGHYFNGAKRGNVWAERVASGELTERETLQLFGLEIPLWKKKGVELDRPFMARFGDIARIDPRGKAILVTLKSGATFELARYAADDLADGVRVWDVGRGVIDIGEWDIRSIELGAAAAPDAGPAPLYGTVRTRAGDFTGFVQWNRKECLGSDTLDGHTADGVVSLRFAGIRSIARHRSGGALVTLLDGREIVLSGSREVAEGNSGLYVDDARYGRVLVSWDAFERVDFSPAGVGPGYDAFAPGGPLTGTVVTRSGRRLAGRMVYDLDESETTETLDAPSHGIDYLIPFRLIDAIVLPDGTGPAADHADVMLRSGEALQLELAGDLGARNGGVLVFVEGREAPEYVSWNDVQRVEVDNPQELDRARARR